MILRRDGNPLGLGEHSAAKEDGETQSGEAATNDRPTTYDCRRNPRWVNQATGAVATMFATQIKN